MKSVPPRGSGWVCSLRPIGKQTAYRPLPRAGTDFIQDWLFSRKERRDARTKTRPNMLAFAKLKWMLALFILSLFLNALVDFEHVSNRSATANFKFERFPSPSKADAATTAKLTLVDGTPDGGSADLTALIDGKVPTKADEPGA